MSKTIDISSKLNNKKPKIKIADDMVYTVNHSKSAILMQQLIFQPFHHLS